MHASSIVKNRWLVQGSFRRDAVVLFSSTALSRGILLLSMPLLARCFSPADIGNWQLFVSFATVLGTIICWRYEVAIPLPVEQEKARDLVGLCVLLAIGMSALLVGPVLLFREGLAALIGATAILPFVWCIPLFTLLYGCEQTATFWQTRSGDFQCLGVARVLKAVLMVAIPLVAALVLQSGVGGLVAGTLIGQLAATVYLLSEDQSRGDILHLGRNRLRQYRTVVLEYSNYPLYVAPYTFLGQFSKRLVYFLLAAFAGSSTVGFFAMAMQLTYVPVNFITAALNQAFFRRAARHNDIRKLEAFVLSILRLQVTFAVPFFVLFVLHGADVLRFVLGPAWDEAGRYVAWLAAPSLMLFFTAWLDRLFDILGRQRLAVFLQLTYDVLSIGVMIALLAMGYPTLVAIAGYTIVTSFYNLAWLTITFQVASFSSAGLWRLLLLAGALLTTMLLAHALAITLLHSSFVLTFEVLLAVTIQALVIRQVGGFYHE